MSVVIKKADGTTEQFRSNKLRKSLRRAGASDSEIQHIVSHIESIIHDNITTQEIYSHAFELLRASEDVPIQARYSLRRGLFNLGPTGFPFEQFLGKLFQAEGYTTEIGTFIQGKCAEHEIDIAAYRDDHSFVAEAKFHSRPGIKSDLQVVMYSYARFLDLQTQKICHKDICGITEMRVITNTKFTTTAENYAACTGLPLLSWDYPKNHNLHDLIQAAGIYPITVLQSLSGAQKQVLIERGAILCRDLIARPTLLRHIHIPTRKHEQVLAEANALCH